MYTGSLTSRPSGNDAAHTEVSYLIRRPDGSGLVKVLRTHQGVPDRQGKGVPDTRRGCADTREATGGPLGRGGLGAPAPRRQSVVRVSP
ncbi:hypothetical protein GCM10009548_44850 [Streptomyces malaysiensis subsp. malaysiensis]